MLRLFDITRGHGTVGYWTKSKDNTTLNYRAKHWKEFRQQYREVVQSVYDVNFGDIDDCKDCEHQYIIQMVIHSTNYVVKHKNKLIIERIQATNKEISQNFWNFFKKMDKVIAAFELLLDDNNFEFEKIDYHIDCDTNCGN